MDRVSVAEVLAEAGCVAAGEEADELIEAAGGDPDVLVDLVSRRTEGEPIAWLTGAVTFCGIELFVAPGVYVPRQQTEALARRAGALLPSGGVAADLCTGAGAVAAALATAVPTAHVLATELDEDAVRCARRNGVEVLQGFLDDPLPRELERRVDVLTAVVPYVPTGALRLLPRDVQAFEPRLALDGGVDGTDVLEEVVRRSVGWLKPGGWLLVELGGDQAEPMGQMLLELGFEGLAVLADAEGDPRAISARLGHDPHASAPRHAQITSRLSAVSELNLVLLGPPGSGKGTQGETLQEDFHLPYYATGDILRAAVRDGTEIGREAKQHMDRGDLVPDEVIVGVIAERVGGAEANDGFILDGFPRTLPQAEALDSKLRELDRQLSMALMIECNDEEVLRRLGGRRSCPNGHIFHVEFDPPKKEGVCDVCGAPLEIRDDDEPEVIRNRLALYHEKTEPLVDYYEKRGVLRRVDGCLAPAKVGDRIRALLATLRMEEEL